MFTEVVAAAAVVLGLSVLGTAPASTDPNQPDPNPDPFGGLTCNCQPNNQFAEPNPDEVERGLRDGLAS